MEFDIIIKSVSAEDQILLVIARPRFVYTSYLYIDYLWYAPLCQIGNIHCAKMSKYENKIVLNVATPQYMCQNL